MIIRPTRTSFEYSSSRNGFNEKNRSKCGTLAPLVVCVVAMSVICWPSGLRGPRHGAVTVSRRDGVTHRQCEPDQYFK